MNFTVQPAELAQCTSVIYTTLSCSVLHTITQKICNNHAGKVAMEMLPDGTFLVGFLINGKDYFVSFQVKKNMNAYVYFLYSNTHLKLSHVLKKYRYTGRKLKVAGAVCLYKISEKPLMLTTQILVIYMCTLRRKFTTS